MTAAAVTKRTTQQIRWVGSTLTTPRCEMRSTRPVDQFTTRFVKSIQSLRATRSRTRLLLAATPAHTPVCRGMRSRRSTRSPKCVPHRCALGCRQQLKQSYLVRQLANSVLIEWVNNNNNFCVPGISRSSMLSLQDCEGGGTAQQFTVESDGSIRHQGQSTQCLDVYNCQTADGAPPNALRASCVVLPAHDFLVELGYLVIGGREVAFLAHLFEA